MTVSTLLLRRTTFGTGARDFVSAIPSPPDGSISPLAGHLPTLDGWRGIAILMVIASHIGGNGCWNKWGAEGVQIFFGISGLLICSRLITELRKNGRISLRGFYLRRVFRILPPAYAYLIIVASLLCLGWLRVSWLQLLGTCFFVNNYLPFHEWYLAHFWSLAVEEHFYLLFPAVLAISGLRLARWIIIAAAVAFACWRSLDQRMGFLTQLLPEVYPQHRTDYCLDALFIGCWVALLADAYRSEFDRWPLLLMGCGGFCVLTVRLAGYFIIPVFFLNLAISFVLITTVLHSQTWIGRILELPPLRWIGRLSYSLYLWQQLFCVARDGSYFFQQWPWNLLATFTCAILSYYFLELPMIRLGHRLNRSASPGSSEEKSAAKRDLSIVATA